MIRIALYFGIGALLHLMFVGSHFDFSSAWTYLWLFAWPLMLVIWGGMLALGVAGVLLCIGIFLEFFT